MNKSRMNSDPFENGNESKSKFLKRTRKALGVSAATAGILLAPGCADNETNAMPQQTTEIPASAIEVAPPTAFDLEQERAHEAARDVSLHLLDLMEDDRTHTETLDTGVQGIANKRYVADHYPDISIPEVRALYRDGDLLLLGIDAMHGPEDSTTFNEAVVVYDLGAETRAELNTKHDALTVKDIRSAVLSGDNHLQELSGMVKYNYDTKDGINSAIFFENHETIDGIKKESILDAVTVTPGTDPELITSQNNAAINAALAGSANLTIK